MNILLTSVGRRSYLVEYFKEALNGDGEVHVMNSSEQSPAFLVADKASVSPLIYDENYIPFLLDYCKQNQIDAVISLFDIDLPILAKNKDKFEQAGVRVIVSNYEFVEVCNDKWKTYNFLMGNGFNAPKTYIKIEDALEDIEKGILEYPVIVKPRWGMGSIAVFEAENEDELKLFYKKTKKNIMKSYLKYESQEDIEKGIVIQEKLDGQEYGIDIINDLEGNYVSTSVKIKYAMRSGETDCAMTVKDKAIEELAEKLAQKSKHIGNLDVDVFKEGNKNYILEMNARFGGGYPFSHIAGVNLPGAIVNWLNNKPVEKEMLTPKSGIIMQKDIRLVVLKND